jgi:hypothetical protein
MGSNGDPCGEPSLALCGPVTSSPKRGAERKGAPATHDICPALSGLRHAAPVTVPAGGVADRQRRSRGGGGAGLRAALHRLRKAPADGRTTPCRTCGDRWWPGDGWPGITISGTAAGGPCGGGAACCNTTPHRAPRPVGSALTLALHKLPTGQQEAIVGHSG